jgi:hypothetical protein
MDVSAYIKEKERISPGFGNFTRRDVPGLIVVYNDRKRSL